MNRSSSPGMKSPTYSNPQFDCNLVGGTMMSQIYPSEMVRMYTRD